VKTLKHYFAFRRIKNFACVEIFSGKVVAYVKVDPDEVELVPGFTRDVRKVGHYGTGDLEITLRGAEDLEKTAPLLLKSYESS
jgi:predicted transport protein